MELNNTIDPNTGLPKLPEDLHWLVSPANKMHPPTIRLRKDTGVQYTTREIKNTFWRNVFFMPKLTEEVEDLRYLRYKTLASKNIHNILFEMPEDDSEYTYYSVDDDRTNRNIYPTGMTEWWFKTDVDVEMVKTITEELWDTYIVSNHKEAIANTLFGMFPPNKIGG